MAIASKAAVADKLDTNAGSSTVPVYFSDGKPVAITSYNGNAATASKLQTARTIYLAGGAVANAQYGMAFDGSKNISIPLGEVYGSYLAWGGRSIKNAVSPIDAAMSYCHNPNRLQFSKPAGITIEYSNDDGATWTDYGANDLYKINLVSGIDTPLYLGKNQAEANSVITKNKLRITINATKCKTYFVLRTLLINVSTYGQSEMQVSIKGSHQGSEDNFDIDLKTHALDGWSGWNSIPINGRIAFGGDKSQTYNCAIIQLTFSFASQTNGNNLPGVFQIIGLGDNAWSFPSNMARVGHLYNWDAFQNALFPAGISLDGILNYKNIETNLSADALSNVWFSHYQQKGRPVTTSNFQYNPKTNLLKVGAITGVANGGVAGTLSINGKTYNGSNAIDVGVIGAAYGGSGQTTLVDSANAYLNSLSAGASIPVDDDYFIAQRAGGGTTITTYRRRPVSALYSYIQSKTDDRYLKLSGGTLTGALTITDPNGFRMVQGDYGLIFRNDGTNFWLIPTKKGDPYGGYNASAVYTRINLDTGVLYGAVWNDYAEYRQASTKEPGRCVVEKGDDTLELSTARLLPGANIVSDTFGFAIGETKDCATPIAVSGRVLAYPYEPRDQFKAGDAVCSGPNGTVSIMTREEIKEYPERIIGTVSSVPTYEKWGSGDVLIDGRVWIKV